MMKLFAIPVLTVLAATAAEQPALTGFPFTNETLRYSVSAPGGVRLGQVQLGSQKSASGWGFTMSVDGGLAGFDVKDNYFAHSNTDFCSVDLTREFRHGAKTGGEKEEIDRSHASATRTTTATKGGGKSQFSVPDCTKDALTFLYYARRELGQGRVAPAQQILFGGFYDVSLQYTGPDTLQLGEKPVITDKVVVGFKGPASELQFEVWFARDAARTPLRFQIPLVKDNPSLGNIALELVR